MSVVAKRLPLSVTAELLFLHDTALVGNSYYTACRRSFNEGFFGKLAATLRWFTSGGAIRITHYDVIDDVITRKL